MENWNLLNQGLIALTTAAIGLFFLLATRFIKVKLSDSQAATVRAIAAQAVLAAEQYGGSNEEKKRAAINMAEKLLLERGIKIDLDSLSDAIEAAVYQQLKQFSVSAEAISWGPGASGHKPEASE